MITFEVTENMLAKVSHHFPALPRLPCIKLIPKTIAHSGMIIYHDWEKIKIQKSKIPYNFLSKYKQQEGTIGEEYLFCLRDCLADKQSKLKDQVILIII